MKQSIYGYSGPKLFESVYESAETLDGFHSAMEALVYDLKNLTEGLKEELVKLELTKNLKKSEMVLRVEELVDAAKISLKGIEETIGDAMEILPDLEVICERMRDV